MWVGGWLCAGCGLVPGRGRGAQEPRHWQAGALPRSPASARPRRLPGACLPLPSAPPARLPLRPQVAKRELALECDYSYEAASQARFKALVEGDRDLVAGFNVPAVVPEVRGRCWPEPVVPGRARACRCAGVGRRPCEP